MFQDNSKPDPTQEPRNQPDTQADYATGRSADPDKVSENCPASPPAWSRILLWIFSIIVSIIAILFDAVLNVYAGMTPDPMPTWLHFFVLLAVPAALILGDRFICHSFRHPNQRWAKRALFANAYAIVVSAIYFVIFLFEIYLKIIPDGLSGIMFLGLTVLPLMPVWCTIGSLLQLKWLYARIKFHRLSVRKAVYYSCFGAVFAAAIVLLAYGYSHIRAGWEEKVKPSMFSSVKFYREHPFDSGKLDSESLAKMPSALWDEKSTHEIFSEVKYHPRGITVWKVPVLAVAKLKDGREKRLMMSHFARSFMIVGQRGHYMITGVSSDTLIKKMEEVYRILASKTDSPPAE